MFDIKENDYPHLILQLFIGSSLKIQPIIKAEGVEDE